MVPGEFPDLEDLNRAKIDSYVHSYVFMNKHSSFKKPSRKLKSPQPVDAVQRPKKRESQI